MLIIELIKAIEFYDEPIAAPIIFPMNEYYINVDYIPGEIWRPICEYVLPNVLPIYSISNYGRVYTHHLNRLMKVRILNGYPGLQLKLKTGEYYHCSIHRLLMIVFNYVDNYNDLVVNHLNGNKSDFDLDNMEWSTNSENVQHAYNTGLNGKNQNHPNSIINNKQAHYICKRISEGAFNNEINDELGFAHDNTIVSSIRRGETWKDISQQYIFNERSKIRCHQLFTDNDVHRICKMMEDGLSNIDIINIMNLDKNKCMLVLQFIRSGKRLTRISKKYNIPYKKNKKYI